MWINFTDHSAKSWFQSAKINLDYKIGISNIWNSCEIKLTGSFSVSFSLIFNRSKIFPIIVIINFIPFHLHLTNQLLTQLKEEQQRQGWHRTSFSLCNLVKCLENSNMLRVSFTKFTQENFGREALSHRCDSLSNVLKYDRVFRRTSTYFEQAWKNFCRSQGLDLRRLKKVWVSLTSLKQGL